MKLRFPQKKQVMCNGLLRLSLMAALFLLLPAAQSGAVEVSTSYLYNLSTFTGPASYYWGRIYLDSGQNETYVATANKVDIYNRNGMEVYHFMIEGGLIYDMAVEPSGDILLLVRGQTGTELIRRNYRGEPKGSVKLYGLPVGFEDGLNSNRMVYRGGLLYLANTASMKVTVIGTDGSFIKGYDIGALLQLSEQEKADSGLSGFNVSSDGTILYTMAAEGSAAMVSPDGLVRSFGKRGSSPGRFGVPAAITDDKMGNLLVTDKLRCVVIIFDKNLKFIKEFGFRGLAPGNLIVPHDIAVDDKNRAYVSQLRGRGVSVYQLRYD